MKKTRPKKQVKKKPVRKIARKSKKIVKKAKKLVKKKPRKKLGRKKPIKKIVRKSKKTAKKTKRTYSVGTSLERLFESPAKVQTMKLFFRNPEESFLLKEAARAMRLNLEIVRHQINKLEKIGFLRSRKISSRKQLFFINPSFDFFNELRELVLRASPVSKEKILKAVKKLGKIKLVLLSGVFVSSGLPANGQGVSRADLLIVGDNINQRKLNTFIKKLEAEAGMEIRCVAMTTEEFNYRYDMYDRFIRDLLNEKGEFLINRLRL